MELSSGCFCTVFVHLLLVDSVACSPMDVPFNAS